MLPGIPGARQSSDMKKRSDRWLVYIVTTVGIVVAGIILTTIIDRTKTEGTTDIRARASATYGLKLIGVIVDINTEKNTVIVDRIQLESNTERMFRGIWNVTPPPEYNLASLPIGSRIRLIADPTKFEIKTNAMTAKQIKKF